MSVQVVGKIGVKRGELQGGGEGRVAGGEGVGSKMTVKIRKKVRVTLWFA